MVLFGTSYYGMTQPMVAARRPPALKAFFCNEICTDYFRHIAAVRRDARAPLLELVDGRELHCRGVRLRVPPLLRAIASQIFNSPLKPLWERQLKKRVNSDSPRLHQATRRPAGARMVCQLDDRRQDPRAQLHAVEGPMQSSDKIEVPFVAVQNLGYFNLHQFGSYDLFENAARRTTANG